MLKQGFLSTALLGLALISAGTPVEAADSASTALQIKGTAQPVCRMPAPSATGQGNTAVSNLTITVQNLINQQDSTVQPWTATLAFADVMCNYAAVLSLRSQNGGMVPVTPARPSGRRPISDPRRLHSDRKLGQLEPPYPGHGSPARYTRLVAGDGSEPGGSHGYTGNRSVNIAAAPGRVSRHVDH